MWACHIMPVSSGARELGSLALHATTRVGWGYQKKERSEVNLGCMVVVVRFDRIVGNEEEGGDGVQV